MSIHEKRDNPPPPVLSHATDTRYYMTQGQEFIELDIDLACEQMGKLCEWIIEKVKVEIKKDELS